MLLGNPKTLKEGHTSSVVNGYRGVIVSGEDRDDVPWELERSSVSSTKKEQTMDTYGSDYEMGDDEVGNVYDEMVQAQDDVYVCASV